MAVARRKALDSGERKERVSPGEGLGTVERVVEILRYFADRGESTLKELAEAVSLAPSTCHRLLYILASNGMIERTAARRSYRIGREFFRLASLVRAKYDLRSIAEPFLRGP